MKRAPLNRHTPMPAQRRRMNRNTPLVPGPPLVRSKPMAVRLRRPPVSPRLRAAVLARAQERCDMCGQPLRPTRWELHHRKRRSQGGQDEPGNCLALHPGCHSKVHANPDWAYRAGLLVRSFDDPATRPVWHRDKAWRTAGATEWIGCTAPANEEVA